MPLIITFVLDVPIGPLTFPVSLPVWEDTILAIGISQNYASIYFPSRIQFKHTTYSRTSHPAQILP